MAFRVPTFNLDVNIWDSGMTVADPPGDTIKGNLTPREGHVLLQDEAGVGGEIRVLMTLLCPKASNINPAIHGGGNDLVEVPAGTGRYYIVVAVDDVARGFPNEYRFAVLLQGTAFALAAYGNPWAAPPFPIYPVT